MCCFQHNFNFITPFSTLFQFYYAIFNIISTTCILRHFQHNFNFITPPFSTLFQFYYAICFNFIMPFSTLFQFYYAIFNNISILLQNFQHYYTPVKDGTYYVITRGGRACEWAGGVPHSLSGAYLQDYASYSYETSWVDRSHQGGVHCTGTITLACLIL